MNPMPVIWKRLITRGQTCRRCEDTGRELTAAIAKLEVALRPLGVSPFLEAKEIDEASFKVCPEESNRVWIAGKPIEEWLGATVEMTRCCTACGESDCRALKVGDRTYETINELLFIKAALMAASQMIAAPEATIPKTCCAHDTNTEPIC